MITRERYYPWLVVACGTLSIFSALGLGRFALGMLLPSMGIALKLTPSQMGLISTSNFTGYLLAVVLCLFMGRATDYRRLIGFALFIVGLSMCFMSGATGFFHAAILYFITGVGSGLANIPTMALVSNWFRQSLRGRAAGFIVVGSGFAIMLSGALVPALNSAYHATGWRISWGVLGAMVLVGALLCYAIIRNRPEDMGLSPLGVDPPGSSRSGLPSTHDVVGFSGGVPLRTIVHLSAIYFCFGASYTIYVTFFVVSVTGERGLSEVVAGGLWGVIGLLSLLSGPIPGFVADKLGRKAALVMVYGMQSLSYALAAVQVDSLFLPWASVVFFGLAAWGIPGVMTALVADVAGPIYTARIFAIVTVVLGVGQVLGPAVAGEISDWTQGFSPAFYLASIIAATGGLLSAMLGWHSAKGTALKGS